MSVTKPASTRPRSKSSQNRRSKQCCFTIGLLLHSSLAKCGLMHRSFCSCAGVESSTMYAVLYLEHGRDRKRVHWRIQLGHTLGIREGKAFTALQAMPHSVFLNTGLACLTRRNVEVVECQFRDRGRRKLVPQLFLRIFDFHGWDLGFCAMTAHLAKLGSNRTWSRRRYTELTTIPTTIDLGDVHIWSWWPYTKSMTVHEADDHRLRRHPYMEPTIHWVGDRTRSLRP